MPSDPLDLPPMRVAILGGGPAGMSACIELLRAGQGRLQPTVFERRSRLGGIWNHEDIKSSNVLFDEHGRAHALATAVNGDWAPGAMFEGLRTNIASDLMTFRDAPFAPGTHLFPDRSTVNDYLKAYGDDHAVERHIRFNRSVDKLRRLHNVPGQQGRWEVTSTAVQDSSSGAPHRIVERFDKVVIATGRCARPSLPPVNGLWNYGGKIMHSSWYRSPVPFLGKKVLVVGNASSGMDIAREMNGSVFRAIPDLKGSDLSAAKWSEALSRAPIQVYQSVEDVEKPPPMDYDPRDPASPDWCRKIQVIPRIKHVKARDGSTGRIIFEDESVHDDFDAIIFATGFVFEFPFLTNDAPFDKVPLLPTLASDAPRDLSPALHCALERQGGPYVPPSSAPRLSNMDDWLLFYEGDASICVLGAPTTVIPFHLTQAQARYVAHRWLGNVGSLPRLDPRLSTTDPARWTSQRVTDERLSTWPNPKLASGTKSESQEAFQLENEGANICSHVFGNPSDSAYVDTLLSLLPEERAGSEAPWEEEYRRNSNGKGDGRPHGSECWYKTPTWRRERRNNGRGLRRERLGY
ncbi:fad nad-binding domain-containing protein [Ceraceosorus bombacis]|uniref:Fad nad-binding domain-containing protein n=1 Tax=Ceraceosorus bombacis TaxID=401625 RepID=A0A0P1BS03_9BASI|nr:fad nad-binding domain-containing protein [Ceraceosorus bombacis]